ncbi:MAG: anion permease [Desulfosarcina sp.]|nr:anion permease [Desulfobacterales bacterium]
MDLESGNPVVTRMAAVAALMAIFWITEAIPLFATALLPLILYPLLGIMKGKAIAPVYFNSTIFLFIGGFMIALTMEKWNLHKRIALWIIKLIGGSPAMIVLGFMAASAFLSMWISNTATAVMMVPMGLAIILKMEEEFGKEDTKKFSVSLMLGIAYACSAGGIATLVGTPPNLSFVRIFEIIFPLAEPISFGQWMLMGVPLMLLMGFFIWIMLTKIFFRPPIHLKADREIVNQEYKALGPVSFEEKAVFAVFVATAFLWIFRKKLETGFITIPGWSDFLPWPGFIDDGTVAMFMAMLLFFIPVKNKTSKESTLMGAEVILRLPWNIVLLFGGGFALAKGFQITGLSVLIGENFQNLAGIPALIMIPLICGSITFITELTSNREHYLILPNRD